MRTACGSVSGCSRPRRAGARAWSPPTSSSAITGRSPATAPRSGCRCCSAPSPRTPWRPEPMSPGSVRSRRASTGTGRWPRNWRRQRTPSPDGSMPRCGTPSVPGRARRRPHPRGDVPAAAAARPGVPAGRRARPAPRPRPAQGGVMLTLVRVWDDPTGPDQVLIGGRTLTLRRSPASAPEPPPCDEHLVAGPEEVSRAWLACADVIVGQAADPDRLRASSPGCLVAVAVTPGPAWCWRGSGGAARPGPRRDVPAR